jgi:hypothetical protein
VRFNQADNSAGIDSKTRTSIFVSQNAQKLIVQTSPNI